MLPSFLAYWFWYTHALWYGTSRSIYYYNLELSPSLLARLLLHKGFQALVLDRTSDPRVSKYQDWLVGPHYVGKSEADIQQCTINSLQDAAARLDAAYVATE